MLQLRHRVRATKGLLVDVDANGHVYIEIEPPTGEPVTFELSKKDGRRLIAELRFLFAKPSPDHDP